MTLFERNVLAYEQQLPRLLQNDEGKYALIRQAEIVGVLESEDAAMTAGYERFGASDFLVKEVLRSDLELIQRT